MGTLYRFSRLNIRTLAGRKKLVLLGALVVTALVPIAAYAALPPRSAPPPTVPYGTLTGQTSLKVLSISAFTRTLEQDQGTNVVLQHLHFFPGQSTLWHTHPGPNIVLVVGGSLTLTDNHCNVTTYGDGQGFATGLSVHMAVAGANGADFYALYLLPASATVLRNPPTGQSAAPPNCSSGQDSSDQ